MHHEKGRNPRIIPLVLIEQLESLQETIEEDREVDRFIAVLEQQAQLTKNAQEQVNRLIAILEKQITMGNEMVI